MRRIDAHIHIHTDNVGMLEALEKYNVKAFNISVPTDNEGGWRQRRTETYKVLAGKYPESFAWCTGFDLPRFDDPKYAAACIQVLEDDFAHGAVACKAWKNIGMDVKKPDGTFIQIDDELFEPIFQWLEDHDRATLLHMAEPIACWKPIEEGKPHSGYYKNNPQWHMYNKPEYPSHETIMAARDRLVARHPKLRVVGAHLASLEWDVEILAERLAKYPNFGVDTSARLVDLVQQDSDKVRAFFIKHQDQIMHGTDVGIKASYNFENDGPPNYFTSETEAYFRYYESDEEVDYHGVKARGLNLPADVLQKVVRDNALKWYPGID